MSERGGLLWRAAAGLLTLLSSQAASQTVSADAVDYSRDVRPILSDNCYACHGPDANTRQAGLRLDTRDGAVGVLPSGRRAVVPGDHTASELLRRVRSADPAHRMPPAGAGHRPLTREQTTTLERWVQDGAPFQSHWAFIPPSRTTPPPTADSAWGQNSIDRFVRAAQEAQGLRPAPPANKSALCRRITLDLTGLPPSPEEVDAFVADQAPGAVLRLIERCLNSPRYGEQMARHWLDAARYGDTHGLHLDNERSMWPYRDWVIDAFNSNQPYDSFVVDQLAGDLLPEPSLEQRIATGFNRCNVTSAEGGMIADEYLSLYAKDRVDTTATVFLGLTLECAKCHDHKFDPFSLKEYYQLVAFFHSIAEDASDKNAIIAPPFVAVPTEDQRATVADLKQRIADEEAALGAPDPAIDEAQQQWQQALAARLGEGWVNLRPREAYSAAGATMTIGADGVVRASGKNPERDVYEVIATTHLRDIRTLRLHLLPDPDQPGGGIGRDSHNNIVLTHLQGFAAPVGRPAEERPLEFDAVSADWNQRDFPARYAVDDKDDTGWAISGGADEDRSLLLRLARPASFVGGTRIKIKLGFGSRFPKHTIARLSLSASDQARTGPATLEPWLKTEQPFVGRNQSEVLKTAFEPEKDPSPDARYLDDKVGWVPAPDYVDGKIHLFSQLPNRAYYLQRIIRSPSARQLTCFFGSDDGIKVFLNGEEVLARDVGRAVAADQERADLNLKAGDNRLMIKIVNGGGACGFYFRVLAEHVDGVPARIARILAQDHASWSDADRGIVRAYYRRNHSPDWRARQDRLTALKADLKKTESSYPRTMVMQQLPKPRGTRLLIRGEYDNPGEEVTPKVPAVFSPLREGQPRDRLALARWITDPKHPLTARVFVNRLWQMLFGAGLVTTPEDFGSQGHYPSHKQLLDWLAVEFVESGWDIQHVLKLILSSDTYGQRSHISAEGLARDPRNTWLARGPRHRLDAEEIRDGALLMGGLLVEQVGGKSVRPYQPSGVWRAVGYTSSNTAQFRRDSGDALWRRSLYTFWKRTAPPPTMSLFDAPSREACSVSRTQTNTPLQALALLNDIQFVEAARAFGHRAMTRSAADDRDRLLWMWRWATSRPAEAEELAVMESLLKNERDHYGEHPDDAKRLVTVGESTLGKDADPAELAAWMSVANMLLNLDETLTKG